MKQFFGVLRYEYRMSIHRWGLVIMTLLLTTFYVYTALSMDAVAIEMDFSQYSWGDAADICMIMNLFFPVLAGIFAADRAIRDHKLNVMELLQVSKLTNLTYILGKYTGVSLSLITCQLAITGLMSVALVTIGAPVFFIIQSLLVSLVITGPAILFVTAFSLACPLLMPVRVYQILFTGYWYWGNYLNPEAFPSISGTYLNASGKYSIAGFFGRPFGMLEATPAEAVLNIAILMACAAIALAGMNFILKNKYQAA